MLPKRHRLRHSADLRRLRQEGRTWRHPLAILIVQANDKDLSRFAFMASRRVGKAVARNKAKRLLRESIRRHIGEIEIGWDCLIIARSKTPEAQFNQVETAVLGLLDRANLLTNSGLEHPHH